MPFSPSMSRLAAAVVFLGVSGGLAQAAEPVLVQMDQAMIYRLAAPARTIVIGNPAIADATLQDAQTLIITGHTYGQTNLIILDDQGEAVADTQIMVQAASDKFVTVYRGPERQSLSCLPDCQPTPVPGDGPAHFTNILSQVAAHDSAGANQMASTVAAGSTTPRPME